MSPTLWKVKREVQRLGGQLGRLLPALHEYAFATRRYDRAREAVLRRHPGRIAASPRVAIYLIFPSGGLLESHLIALDYLASKGYAPLVVSNLPLSEADRVRLLDHCWSYLERPNIGYDFGGYRDAVLDLAHRFGELDRLAILNDSSWFPLPGARDWLDEVEALEVDFAGAVSNYGTPRPEPERFRDIGWDYRTDHPSFHYCSFALVLRPRAFRDPGFVRYWKRLKLAERKSRTVRRGEIGLTRWALRAGLSHGTTLDIAHLDRDLAALPEARLREVAQELIVLDNPRLRAVQRDLLAGSPSRADLIALILTAVSRQGASYALADHAMHEKGYPFLKKSPVWLERAASDTTLRLAGGLEGPQGAIIYEEARELRRTKGARLDAPDAGA